MTFRHLPDSRQPKAGWMVWGKGLVHFPLYVVHSIKTSLLGTINETSGMRGWLLKTMSFCYECAVKKITTHDHTLHLALRQPVLIWDWVALTQVQAISNTMIICCHTKDRLSSGNSVQSVLDFKSGGISLPLTDCAPLASHLCGPASSSLHKIVPRVPPAFRGVHRFMPLSIILWYTVIKTISQLF